MEAIRGSDAGADSWNSSPTRSISMAKEIFEFIDRIFQGSISGWEMNLAEGGKGEEAGGGWRVAEKREGFICLNHKSIVAIIAVEWPTAINCYRSRVIVNQITVSVLISNRTAGRQLEMSSEHLPESREHLQNPAGAPPTTTTTLGLLPLPQSKQINSKSPETPHSSSSSSSSSSCSKDLAHITRDERIGGCHGNRVMTPAS